MPPSSQQLNYYSIISSLLVAVPQGIICYDTVPYKFNDDIKLACTLKEILKK